jgi:hypothetical protein
MVIGSGASFKGAGTYKLRGNIDNSADTSHVIPVDSIAGMVKMVGTAAETIGVGAVKPILFQRLSTDSSPKMMKVTVSVETTLTLTGGSLKVNGHPLNIDGASAKLNGILVANGTGDIVNYRGTSSQSIIGSTYTTLNLLNSGTKDFLDTVTAGTLTHSGGALHVDKNLSVTGTATIGEIVAIDSAKILSLGTTSVIDTVNANSGNVSAGIDSTTIKFLSSNTGKIVGSSGALIFVTPVSNNGDIIGGTGLVTFDDSMKQNSDTLKAGPGGILFKGIPTIAASGTVTSDSGSLMINTDLHNNGTFSLTHSGSAQIAGNFLNAGTTSFDSTTTVIYGGGVQSVVTAKYGNLVLNGSANKTVGNLTVAGNLTLTKDLTVNPGNSLTMTSSTPLNISDTGEVVGTVRRTNRFTADTAYDFNRKNVTLGLNSTVASDTISLTMIPDSNIVNSPSTKYVKRYYAFASSNLGAATLSSIELEYTNPEIQNNANKSKLGIREFNGSTWSKVTGPGYARTVDTVNNTVTVTNVSASLAGVTEFAVISTSFNTIASNRLWSDPTAWDEGSVPGATDDADINNPGITVSTIDSVGTVTLATDTSGLTISANLIVGSLTDPLSWNSVDIEQGSLTVNANATLSVASSLLNKQSLIVNTLGMITMRGKLLNYGTVTNSGTINIGQ